MTLVYVKCRGKNVLRKGKKILFPLPFLCETDKPQESKEKIERYVHVEFVGPVSPT